MAFDVRTINETQKQLVGLRPRGCFSVCEVKQMYILTVTDRQGYVATVSVNKTQEGALAYLERWKAGELEPSDYIPTLTIVAEVGE